MEKVNLQDFYDMLEDHDWYYAWSDDGRVYEKGSASLNRLSVISRQSPEHFALFEAYSKHMFTGKPWNTEQAPKPQRPE